METLVVTFVMVVGSGRLILCHQCSSFLLWRALARWSSLQTPGACSHLYGQARSSSGYPCMLMMWSSSFPLSRWTWLWLERSWLSFTMQHALLPTLPRARLSLCVVRRTNWVQSPTSWAVSLHTFRACTLGYRSPLGVYPSLSCSRSLTRSLNIYHLRRENVKQEWSSCLGSVYALRYPGAHIHGYEDRALGNSSHWKAHTQFLVVRVGGGCWR
jgi:hypothetical protein